MNLFIKIGLTIFAAFMLINFTVYKFGSVPTIIILGIACILMLVGAFRR